MPRESPTNRTGMPASSSSLVMGKSYVVSAAIRSPRAFMARIVSAVILGFIEATDEHRLTQMRKMQTICGHWCLSVAETLEQFALRGCGGADLADDDAGGMVGQDRGFNRRRAGG